MRWLGKGGRRLVFPSKGGLSNKPDWDSQSQVRQASRRSEGGVVGVMEAAAVQQQRSERERDVSREGRESFGGRICEAVCCCCRCCLFPSLA